MRLIDADAFKQTFCAVCVRTQCENCNIAYHFEYLAPTVDPIKHGHWIKNDNGTYSCSKCQSWIPNEQYYYARYCLHCGAKMDEVIEMAVELRKCNKFPWAFCDGDCEKCRTFATTETVYNRYTDTAGNYHWTGAYSGEHIVRMGSRERKENEID